MISPTFRFFPLVAIFLAIHVSHSAPSVHAGEILWATVQHGCGDATYSLLNKKGGKGAITHHLSHLSEAPQQFKVHYVEDCEDDGIVGDKIRFSYEHSVVGHDQNGVIKLKGRIRIQDAHDINLGSDSLPDSLMEPTHLVRGSLKYELYENGSLADYGTFKIREKQYGGSFLNGIEYDGESGSLYIRARERRDVDDETGYRRGIDLVVSLNKHSVPEPTTLALSALSLGGLAAASALRKRARR